MNNSVRSVEKAAQILDLLTASPGEQRLAELSEGLGLSKSTLHQLLRSLCNSGMVEQNPDTHAYRLGYKTLQLGAAYLSRLDTVERAQRQMRRLWEVCGETLVLSRVQGDQRIQVAVMESRHEVRYSPTLGQGLPITEGAAGKAILAFLPRAQQEEILSRAQGGPEGVAAALDELSRIARDGYAISSGQRVAGYFSVAAPIWNWRGTVDSSLSIVAPAERCSGSQVQNHLNLVLETTRAISLELGARPPANVP